MQGGASLARRPHKRQELAQLVIYRILLLVLLLDRVPRHMQLPQDAPFLFRLNSACKSSEEVTAECLQSSLAGIGKLSRHLTKAGYVVDHRQRDVDEWPMQVAKMGPDLSNGIILCKLVSVLFDGTVRPIMSCCQNHWTSIKHFLVIAPGMFFVAAAIVASACSYCSLHCILNS
jgi:hypothetical protein